MAIAFLPGETGLGMSISKHQLEIIFGTARTRVI